MGSVWKDGALITHQTLIFTTFSMFFGLLNFFKTFFYFFFFNFYFLNSFLHLNNLKLTKLSLKKSMEMNFISR